VRKRSTLDYLLIAMGAGLEWNQMAGSKICPGHLVPGKVSGMKLEDLPKLMPGLTLRVKVYRRLHFVTIKHEGREGHGVHKQLTFATRRAVLSLATPEGCPAP
jgi:hypothetical protein